MEFERKDREICGLNREFMSSINCEGINIPVYKRKGEKFYPAASCNGNCLNCKKPLCGIDELALGKVKNNNYKGFTYYDYLKWSRKEMELFK